MHSGDECSPLQNRIDSIRNSLTNTLSLMNDRNFMTQNKNILKITNFFWVFYHNRENLRKFGPLDRWGIKLTPRFFPL